MIDVLTTPDQAAQYEALLNRTFPVAAGDSFFDDFPVWSPLCTVLDRISVGVVQQGEVVAGASARIASLRTARGILPVAIIGGVCCDGEYRGKGYASRLVEILVQWSQDQGVSAQLLWSTEAAMYERLGFRSSGTQVRYALETSGSVVSSPEEIHDGWDPRIWELLMQRTRGLALRPEDRAWFEQHKNTHWVYVGTKEKPLAYAAVGRGIDLPGMLHEWGGDPAQVQRIFAHLKQHYPELQVLGSPADATLRGLVELVREPLCLMRGEDLGEFWIWGLDAA